jgi:hypothetical protein
MSTPAKESTSHGQDFNHLTECIALLEAVLLSLYAG